MERRDFISALWVRRLQQKSCLGLEVRVSAIRLPVRSQGAAIDPFNSQCLRDLSMFPFKCPRIFHHSPDDARVSTRRWAPWLGVGGGGGEDEECGGDQGTASPGAGAAREASTLRHVCPGPGSLGSE